MKRYLTTLLLAILCSLAASPQTASIKKVWLEQNVTLNGKKAMKVHCHFTVQGMKGRQGNMTIFIKNPQGKWHDVNSGNVSKTGVRHFTWPYKPGYDDAVFKDWWYCPYITDMKLSKGTYKIVVTINDDKGKILAQSVEYPFSYTPSAAPSRKPRQQSGRPSPGGGNRTWRENMGYGGFVEITRSPNGYEYRVYYVPCISCRGTKACGACSGTRACNVCGGRGGIVSAGYGNFYPCQLCRGTGRCSLCGGTGGCVCNKFDHPGYSVSNSALMDPNGRTVSSQKYNLVEAEQRHRTNPGKKVCPDCKGTGMWRYGQHPEYGMPTVELIAHYNPNGTKCRYCGYLDKHWHSRCTTCKHYYGTENPYR